jgi:hypothetical protein
VCETHSGQHRKSTGHGDDDIEYGASPCVWVGLDTLLKLFQHDQDVAWRSTEEWFDRQTNKDRVDSLGLGNFTLDIGTPMLLKRPSILAGRVPEDVWRSEVRAR